MFVTLYLSPALRKKSPPTFLFWSIRCKWLPQRISLKIFYNSSCSVSNWENLLLERKKNSLRIMLMWAHLRFTKWILITLWYKISFKHYRYDDSVENLVEINNLTRDDVNSVLRCRAVNNNISAPVETRILLDIIRKIFSYQPASLKRRRFLLFSFNCHRKLVLIFWQGTGGIVTKLFSTLNMKIIRGFSINSNSWGVIIKIQILWSWVILLNISWKKFCKTCQESFVNKISWSI